MEGTSRKKHKDISIFRHVLLPMGILLFIEIALLTGSIFGGGITDYVNQNAKDILHERGINRKSFLETEMLTAWSQLELTMYAVNDAVQTELNTGSLQLDDLDDSSEIAAPILLEISDNLIAMLRRNRVTGAFVVFNTEDMSSLADDATKPALYVRDLDPSSPFTSSNQDLLLEKAPVSMVRDLNLPMDNPWSPMLELNYRDADGKAVPYAFLYTPFMAAYNSDGSYDPLSLAYWSEPYTLPKDDKKCIAYSIPLVLDDGTVYGVLGVEITVNYLNRLLPYEEIIEDRRGSYILALDKDDDLLFDNITSTGGAYYYAEGNNEQTLVKERRGDGYTIEAVQAENDLYCHIEYLNLYNSNTPFAEQKWALISVVRERDLFAFSTSLRNTLIMSIFITLLVGLLGTFLISMFISRPIVSLNKGLREANPHQAAELPRTHINEIDRLAESIEELNKDVIDTSSRFARIIEMSSMQIAGYEIDEQADTITFTDGFFDIFLRDDIDVQNMTPQKFKETMKQIGAESEVTDGVMLGEYIFHLNKAKQPVYVKLKVDSSGDKVVGVVEDVTASIMEKKNIEHERDHDLLTGLLNRRAFMSEIRELFEDKPEDLGVAALVMMDLDNLKHINDTYGHDYGDKYIQSAAECMLCHTPRRTITSRIAGDEFYLLFYGYRSKEEIISNLAALQQSFDNKFIHLPDKQAYPIHISGGVAWYPYDSRDYTELLKFSDFAMYKVKQSEKGRMGYFDLGGYNKEVYLMQNISEFNEFLTRGLVKYHFQPIVSARTGELFAYEALMRADMQTIKSPLEILDLAKRQGKLAEIERLTWYKSMEAYVAHIKAGRIMHNSKLFINSIGSDVMSNEEIHIFENKYRGWLDRIVIEITEEEQLNEQAIKTKMDYISQWNAEVAVDDYGSGYNSEKILLTLSPQYIKVDMDLIREIDRNKDKQTIVGSIISYAHKRDMKIIAEGVETSQELRTLIAMNVDFVQGYYIAAPDFVPPQAPTHVASEIRYHAAAETED